MAGGLERHEEGNVAPGRELRVAAYVGQMERVQELLDQGVDVDARDAYEETALMMVSYDGRTEVVELLLSRQAQVDAQTRRRHHSSHGCCERRARRGREAPRGCWG